MDKHANLIQYKIFSPFKKLLAFTTTKQTLEQSNCRFTGDTVNIYKANRNRLAEELEISSSQLIFPRQTHTNCVAKISDVPINEIEETDALISNLTGICLCVQTADCVPILLFDPIKNTISAVHAGWRGTVKNITEIAVQKMISEYGSSPENIIAAIGPSIGPEVYEVGNEVVAAIKNAIPYPAQVLLKNKSGKFHINLWEANRQILMKQGILSEKIEILGECSFQNSAKYYSARRDGIETGRMVSGIMLR